MRIGVDQIPDEGLVLDKEEAPSIFEFLEKGFVVVDKIRVKCEVSKTSDGVYVKGEVSTVLELTCDRCTEVFPWKVCSKLNVSFVPKPPEQTVAHEVELSSEDLDAYYFEGNEIDLRGPVRDLVVVSIPMKSLCHEECKGLCPECGKKLEQEKCHCESREEVDPRFAVLKNLIDRKE